MTWIPFFSLLLNLFGTGEGTSGNDQVLIGIQQTRVDRRGTHTLVALSYAKNIYQKGKNNKGIHIMTKVYCFFTTMFQCKHVIAQVPKRGSLEEGCILMYVHTNLMSSSNM